ncbi:MAG TPA: GNAT family N-acetyltransferase [Phycisphaerae bacterium]|nr:GNAT family N-acetyltransferase [Phycisphaerae bacterium]
MFGWELVSGYNFGWMTRIRPVPKRKRLEALRHLTAGGEVNVEADLRAASFLRMFRATRGLPGGIWWVRDGRKIRAVAMVRCSKGRVGFLHHSPAAAKGVNCEALVELVRAITHKALTDGAFMLQSLLDENSPRDADILGEAGFEELAELLYMRRNLYELPESPDFSRWSFRNYHQFKEEELVEVIRLTYQGTHDCPRLSGVRKLEDVIVSHKFTGRFSPQWWWVAYCKDRPAGCILVNRSGNGHSAEIAYMGVAPLFRGQQLGYTLLCWASNHIQTKNIGVLNLAVDARNTYAKDLYERFGFQETRRKRCFIFLR